MLRGVAFVGVAPLQNGPAVDCRCCPFVVSLALCFSHCCFFLGCGSGSHAVLYTLLVVKIWPFLSPLSLVPPFHLGAEKRTEISPLRSSWSLFSSWWLYLCLLFGLFFCFWVVCKSLASRVRCACLCSCCQSDGQFVHQSLIHVWSSYLVSCLLWLVVR